MPTTVRAADPFMELALHGLAHLPLRGPERLYDPRYLAMIAAWPEAAREPLASDAAQLGAELERTSASLAAQWLPVLHRTVVEFLRTGGRELGELKDADADAASLAALLRPRSFAIEWLRTDLLLVAEGFVAHRVAPSADACAFLAGALQEIPEAERPHEVALSAVLGPRGRGFAGGLVVVGEPAPWWCADDVDRLVPVVLALHEHAVLAAPGDHRAREWSALTTVAARMDGYPASMRAAHARWLRALDLDDVAPVALHAALADRDRRAATLAAHWATARATS